MVVVPVVNNILPLAILGWNPSASVIIVVRPCAAPVVAAVPALIVAVPTGVVVASTGVVVVPPGSVVMPASVAITAGWTGVNRATPLSVVLGTVPG